jgi:putative phosphoesterase
VLVAVVSDTHLPRGSRALPPECMRRLAAADLILHAGDHSSVASFDALRAVGPPVEAVFGNADEPDLRALLPAELVVEAAGTRIGLVHDAGPRAGREERLLRRFPGCDAVVYGHTHLPQVELLARVWILNPGSPTERRRAPAKSMLELRIGRRKLEPTLVELSV